MVSPVLLYSHRDTHPHYGHLAVVDSPMVQKFLQCYIQRRQNQGLLGHAGAWHGKWTVEYDAALQAVPLFCHAQIEPISGLNH